jgi:uncharacterized integral membrane protein
VLGGLLVLFALQNLADVQLTFLFWTFHSRRFVVIGSSLLVGLAIGWLLGVTNIHRDVRRREHCSEQEPR